MAFLQIASIAEKSEKCYPQKLYSWSRLLYWYFENIVKLLLSISIFHKVQWYRNRQLLFYSGEIPALNPMFWFSFCSFSKTFAHKKYKKWFYRRNLIVHNDPSVNVTGIIPYVYYNNNKETFSSTLKLLNNAFCAYICNRMKKIASVT